jgi:hypothetical protein
MTTIVRHRRTGNEYILLGITGETDKANPSRFISEFFSQDKSEVSSSATVCDVRGNIFLAYIDDLVVTEIDGKKPADLLPEPADEPADNYDSEPSDFEDEEFEEELDEELKEKLNEDRDITSTEPQTSFVYGQGSTAQSKADDRADDDEEDWI